MVQAMNSYIDIKDSFQFLVCAVRQKEMLKQCRSLPHRLSSRNSDTMLRDYLFCLILVRTIAQLEYDIEMLTDIPGLHKADKLSPRLRILRDHFQISADVYDAVDRIRDARNQFIHDGSTDVNAGRTMAEVPGVMVTFLQRCRHPAYS